MVPDAVVSFFSIVHADVKCSCVEQENENVYLLNITIEYTWLETGERNCGQYT
jgi:hypothetical protein